jgi:hypothetical protein
MPALGLYRETLVTPRSVTLKALQRLSSDMPDLWFTSV